MGTKIEGAGNGIGAGVNKNAELLVVTETPMQKAMREGRAYSWGNITANWDAVDTLLAVRNESTMFDLVIEKILVANGDSAICNYTLHVVTAAYTNAGTAVTGVNLNSNYGNNADATATADETGNTQGTILQQYWAVLADTTYEVPFAGIVLKEGHALAIDLVTESGRGTVEFVGYFVER